MVLRKIITLIAWGVCGIESNFHSYIFFSGWNCTPKKGYRLASKLATAVILSEPVAVEETV